MRSTSHPAEAMLHGRWMGWYVLATALVVLAAPAGADDRPALEPEQIRMVQRALVDLGHPVEITGAWDQSTRTAVADFQRERGLTATGTLDTATSRALGVDPYAVVPVGGMGMRAGGSGLDPSVNCAVYNTVDCRPGP